MMPGCDLISDALPFGRLWYQQADAAVGYAKFYSRSQPGEVRAFDATGALIAAENWPGDFRERWASVAVVIPHDIPPLLFLAALAKDGQDFVGCFCGSEAFANAAVGQKLRDGSQGAQMS